jgi:uncharacterized membrane protein HdeD (DUF308 family)
MMADLVLFSVLGQRWWMLLIRGIAAIVFGLLAFSWPGLTIIILTALFAAYALVDGIFALVVGVHAHWWVLAFVGMLGIVAGLVAFFYPGLTALTLLLIIAAWAIVRGIIEITAAIQLRKVIANEWALILGGLCSVVFGIILFARPAVGALAVIWIIGAYALIIGIFLIILSFRVKHHHHALGVV